MAGFLSPLVVTPLPDGKYWETTRDLEYCVGSADSSVKVIVPIGFKTDFASVPQLLWNVLPPTGKYTAATVLHDWLYQNPFTLTMEGDLIVAETDLNRKQCDDIFYEAMVVLEVGWFTRRVIYWGVRAGGWKPWNKYRKENTSAHTEAATGTE